MIPPEVTIWQTCLDCGGEYRDADGPGCADECLGCGGSVCHTMLVGQLCEGCADDEADYAGTFDPAGGEDEVSDAAE